MELIRRFPSNLVRISTLEICVKSYFYLVVLGGVLSHVATVGLTLGSEVVDHACCATDKAGHFVDFR